MRLNFIATVSLIMVYRHSGQVPPVPSVGATQVINIEERFNKAGGAGKCVAGFVLVQRE